MCPLVPEVASSLNWCGSQTRFTRVVCRVAVLTLFMISVYVQKISLLLLLVAMDVVSGRTNQVQDM